MKKTITLDGQTFHAVPAYKVTTFGGQIIDDQTPEACTLWMTEEAAKDFEKRGYDWDDIANYYTTIEKANHAINWALSN